MVHHGYKCQVLTTAHTATHMVGGGGIKQKGQQNHENCQNTQLTKRTHSLDPHGSICKVQSDGEGEGWGGLACFLAQAFTDSET